MKTKEKPKVLEAAIPPQNECCTEPSPCREPDPEVVALAWRINMWENRLKNAQADIVKVDKQRALIMDEIEQIMQRLEQARSKMGVIIKTPNYNE